MLDIKTADNVTKRSTSVKWNDVLKSISHHSYGSYCKTLVVKSAEQTIVSWQENTVSPEANTQRLKQQKLEGMLQSDTMKPDAETRKVDKPIK